jgi:hypothetical protein
MAKNLSASAAAAKWLSRMQGAADAVKAGVAAVTQAPQEAAAASADYWQQRVSDNRAKEKFVAGLQASGGLSGWQRAMTEKGAANMVNGARLASPKVQAFMSAFLPVVQANAEQVRSMPKGTLADSVARAAKMIELNSQFRYRR